MTYEEAIRVQDATERVEELGRAFAKLATAANVCTMAAIDLAQSLPVYVHDPDDEA